MGSSSRERGAPMRRVLVSCALLVTFAWLAIWVAGCTASASKDESTGTSSSAIGGPTPAGGPCMFPTDCQTAYCTNGVCCNVQFCYNGSTCGITGYCNCLAGWTGPDCSQPSGGTDSGTGTCPLGQYSNGGICTTCSSTNCMAGQYYDSTQCTGTSSGCMPCTGCMAGQYQQSACTTTSNTVCAPCTACSAGQYQTAACTVTSNTQCASCTAIANCTTETCTTSTDQTCQQCAPGYTGTTCQYSNATTCSGHGTAQSNGTCICDTGYTGSNCSTCAAGTFTSGGSCVVCSSAICGPGQWYNAGACGGTSNGCTSCTACSAGQYASTACTSTSDTVCSACSSCTTGQYQTSACTSTQNTQCATCSSCTAGQYQISACSSSQNTQCGTCAVCGAGQYPISACTTTSNTSCGTCSPIANCASVSCTTSSNSTCSQCNPGFAGSTCQYSDAVTCSGHGIAQANGTCVCNSGWTGASCNTCATGTFLSGGSCVACSSALCGASQWYNAGACSGTSNGCTSCTQCSAGQYASTACTSTSDAVCSSCSQCLAGTYQTAACTTTQNTQCATCSVCPAGQYQSGACTTTQNTQCATCAVCGPGQYQTAACTTTSNTTCGTCSPIANCASVSCTTSSNSTCSQCNPGFAGSTCQYSDSGTCSGHGTAQANGTCLCQAGWTGASCNTCAAGTFLSGGLCVACSASLCGPNTYYDAAACTGTSNGCTACTSCGPNTYASSACTSTANTVCSQCASCGPNQYASGACTSTTNTVCSQCSTCSPGQYVQMACSTSTNTVCAACTPIANCSSVSCTTSGNSTCAQCNPGFAGSTCQYSDAGTCSGHGTAQANGSCLCQAGWTGASCSSCASGYYASGGACVLCSASACGPNQFYNASICAAASNGCTTCSTCGVGQYASGACTQTSDTQCSSCLVCGPGQYASSACTSTTNTVCSACSACGVGQYQTATCTSSANTACASCSACGAGQYVQSACSSTADTLCASCTAIAHCAAQPTCTSASNSTCPTCLAGYAGSTCQYSDAITCSGHGTAQVDGSCVCASGYAGTSCNACAGGFYSSGGACVACAASNCGAGQFFTAGSCGGSSSGCASCSTCASGQFASGGCNGTTDTICSACSTCAAGQYASSACTSTKDTVCAACSPIANCATQPTCTSASSSTCASCVSGYAGTQCQYSDATTCNGHGAVQADGSCVCTAAYAGATCASCSADHYGYPSCVYCLASACAPPAACQQAASCDASGKCAYAPQPSGTQCSAASCAGGTATSVGKCNGTDPTCPTATTSACAPWTCNASGTACNTTCATDADCASGAHCIGNACAGGVANGVACTSAAQCASGNCVDGVCCATACNGTCQACAASKTGLADGTCGNAKEGIDPHHSCAASSCTSDTETDNVCDGAGTCHAKLITCQPSRCDAAGVACRTSCTTDADCASTGYCAGATCAMKRVDGASCTTTVECLSGNCADGVCCDTPCTGTCAACTAAKKGSGVDGNCGFIADATDPDAECPNKTCKAGVAESGHACDGKGACRALATAMSCSPYACDAAGASCMATCAQDADCASGFRCAAGQCTKGSANGVACASPGECDSGFCVNGVCCNEACDGPCMACSATMKSGGQDGTCGPIQQGICALNPDAGVADAAPPPDSSAPPTVTATFQRCTSASDCASGFCVDGVCCDSACNQRCYSCALAASPGHCAPEPAGVDLRSECAPGHACLGTCDGNGACIAAGAGTLCENSKCTGPNTGIGASYCSKPGAECPIEDAVPFECGAYVCEPTVGRCKTSCATSDDCSNGNVCDPGSSTCVPPTPPTQASGGCSLGARPSSRGAGVPLSIVLGLVAIVWGRRRRVRHALISGAVATTLGCGTRAAETTPASGDASLEVTSAASEAPASTGDGTFVREAGGFVARRALGGLRSRFDARGLTLSAPGASWTSTIALASVGADAIAGVEPALRGGRVEFARGHGVVEWWAHDARGVEQGFTLSAASRVAGEDVVRLGLALAGDLRPVAGHASIELVSPNGARVLAYGAIAARDAKGVSLPATMRVRDGRIELEVDVRRAAWPVTVDPPVWALQAELRASDGVLGDAFGGDVALDVASSGVATSVVGAPAKTIGGSANQGAAYVFLRGTTSWSQQTELLASDGAAGDGFGGSVAIAGDTAIVGAPSAGGQGAAYVFVRTSGTWAQQAKLVEPNGLAGDEFGEAVALSGDTAAIGARSSGAAGAAYVFVRSGTMWSQQAKLVSSDAMAGDRFGDGVAIDVDTIVVGASAKPIGGAAYVFVRSGTVWSQQAKLAASDAASGDAFGANVSVNVDTVAVGAAGKTIGGNAAQGAAYVFFRSGSAWAQQGELLVGGGAANDAFGADVAANGDTVLVGASGEHVGGTAAGAVHVWTRSAGAWSQSQLLVAADAASGDALGDAVAVGTDGAVAGAPTKTGGGATYAFVLGKDLGVACAGATECASRLCVDGVCCDTPCDGSCVACTKAKKGAGVDGNCGSNADGTDPDHDCLGQTCFAGTQENGHACDGKGACRPLATTPCTPYACANASTCATSCASDVDCATGFFCDGSTCKAAQKLGEACPRARACASGFCADGVCCDRACVGACEACSVAEKGYGFDGTCGSVFSAACVDAGAAETSVDDAGPDEASVADAPPPQVTGSFQRCIKATDCTSGFCVDGVCCDSACDEPCHSCALTTSPGKCSLEPKGVDLRAECGPAHGCLGTCDGKGACTGEVSGAQCEPSKCTAPTKGAGAVRCLAAGAACPVEKAVEFDCAPFVCEPAFGVCRSECGDSNDCANGFVCTNRQCVAPDVPPASSGGGCSTSGGASLGAGSPFAALAALAALAWARRRRARG